MSAHRHRTAIGGLACGVVALLSVASGSLAAQKLGTLGGVVIGSGDEAPIPARLSLGGTTLSVVAAPDGAFRIGEVPVGQQSLSIRMLGYEPAILSVHVRSGESLFVKVVLKPVALALQAIDVSEFGAPTPQLQGFEERRARGMGVFFTREDILRMQPRLFTDILRRVPGMQIRQVQGGHGDNVSVQASRSKPCSMQFYVNAMPVAMLGDSPVNHHIAPEDVVGVEVYSGSSEIPPQFNASNNNSRCGVVVVWTRVGRPQR